MRTTSRGIIFALTVAVLGMAVMVGVPAVPAVAAGPASPAVVPVAPVALDCTNWRYGAADEPASLPPEFDRSNYKDTSLRDPRPALHGSPQNQCGQKGSAVDLAWGLSRGTPAVVIAVLDSGIRWRDPAAMADLATKVHINLGEAPPPCMGTQPDGDCNHDGVFDITDFGAITDRNGNGVADPEDLILDPARNDGVDDDHDGHVDDIAGWDFLYGDNDPFDTVAYGHGTGEALDSTAAENGTGNVGTCPGCQVLPVRVGDSFIADGGRFAAGVLFALDNGADVIQEALGAISNPVQAQQAIDAAYRRGVPIVASMADEASKHPNLPGALEHTMAVNSVTEKKNNLFGGNAPPTGYLALNGCTNFGGRTFVSVPSGACSSEATGQAAGMVGLLESYAREVGLTAPAGSPTAAPGTAGTNALSADETMQLVRAAADDIDFSTPNAVDPANNFGTSNGSPLLDTVSYPSRPGWDATFGYGRVNAYEMLKAVRDRRIPPEAMIDSPTWLAVLPVTGSAPVTGHVGAPRAASYDYRVEWAPGGQPPAYPATDTWTDAGGQAGLTAPLDGTLATLDLAAIAASLPDGGHGAPVDAAHQNRPDEERFSVRLRVVVLAHGGTGDGLTGEMQKQVFVHDDPDLAPGFPKHVASAGTASPVFADLGHDGRTELVLATDDGSVHAWLPDGSELAGFPVRSDVSPWWPTQSPTAAADGIQPHHAAIMLGGPAIGDLDRDGYPEIVATDLDGHVSVWSHTGARVATMGVNPAYSRDDVAAQDEHNRTKPGFTAAPSLGDLDGDGRLEIVAAALDRHVYAWHGDGSPVAGFPVLVVDPAKVAAVDPTSHKVTFAPGSGVAEGGELTATPTLADLDGDGHPEIIVGAQEEYVETPNIGDGAGAVALLKLTGSAGNSRLYAISPLGLNATVSPPSAVQPAAQAYLPGWPAKLALAQTELLPTIGDGVAMPAVVGDVNAAHPGPEIVAASAAGPIYVLDQGGHSVFGATPAGDLPLFWSAGPNLADAGKFGAQRNSNDLVASLAGFSGPALGDLTGDGTPEVVAPTAGLTRLLDLLVPDLQLPNDDQLSGWDGGTRLPLPGSPQATPDLAFFGSPAVADLNGDGAAESIVGNGVYTVSAVAADGAAPPGWPKLTGGWVVGTPGVGDWDGDGTIDVATVRRDGTLLVWHTAGAAAGIQWSQWGCDLYHSGACVDTAPAALPVVLPSTTTTTGPSATTSTTSTASTTPAASPAVPPPTSTSVAPSADVAAAATGASGPLPATGGEVGRLLLVGSALVGAGVVVLRGRRPRRSRRSS